MWIFRCRVTFGFRVARCAHIEFWSKVSVVPAVFARFKALRDLLMVFGCIVEPDIVWGVGGFSVGSHFESDLSRVFLELSG